MFGRAGNAGKDGVVVHFHVVEDIAADHRALAEVHIVEHIDDLGCIMQILHPAIAVMLAVHVHQVNRGTRRAVMHARARQIEVVQPVAAHQGQAAVGLGQRILHQCTRKADAAIAALHRARACQIGHAGGRRIGQADGLERVEGGVVDLEHVRLRKRFVLAALQARADGAQIVGKGGRTRGAARGTATGARRGHYVHGMIFLEGRAEWEGGQTPCGAPRAARPRIAPIVRLTSMDVQSRCCMAGSL